MESRPETKQGREKTTGEELGKHTHNFKWIIVTFTCKVKNRGWGSN